MSFTDTTRDIEGVNDRPEGIFDAVVHSNTSGRLLVTVTALDGRARALRARGHYPDAQPGDPAWVQETRSGYLVCVAWEPA